MLDNPLVERMDTWITPLYVTEFSGHVELEKELKDCVYQHRAMNAESVASGIAITAKQSLYESTLDFLQQDRDSITILRAAIEEQVLIAAQDANQEVWPESMRTRVTVTESWCHITRNGGYHDTHSHPNCSWCGIYYLDIGESNFSTRNGVNRFYDPRINAEHYLDAGSSYLNAEGVWDIDPVDGHIIIFPSYLKHAALPYFGEKDRIVIAFNCQVHFCDE